MECLVQVALHQFPVSADGIRHGRCRRTRWCKQRFDEADGLVGTQLDQVALIDDLTRNFAGMDDDEGGHRATLKRRRSLEKLLVCRRNPGDESLAFLLFHDRIHGQNVCRAGTHCKH